MKKTIHRYSLLFICLIALLNCSSKTELKTTSLKSINFEFEGPIYSGPNSATAELSINLSEVLGAIGDIKDVKLKSATIVTDSSTTLAENLQSLSLQIGSSNQPLISIAVLNPVDATNSKQELLTSKDKNLTVYLLEKSFYLVLDADFLNDSDDSQLLTGSFELEIHYTNK